MAQNLVNKLSARSIGVDLVKARKEPQECFTILGHANKVERGMHSTNGEWTKLKGNFEAVNLTTGEIFVSTAAFLPKIVNDLVSAAIDQGGEVKFAYTVGTKPNETPTGYEYTIRPLLDAEPVNAIEEIRALVAAKPALAAPKSKTK